jgi:hypothetical protein
MSRANGGSAAPGIERELREAKALLLAGEFDTRKGECRKF